MAAVASSSQPPVIRPFYKAWSAWLTALWFLALAVRLRYVAEIADSPMWLVKLGDARAYDAWARAIAAGDWFGEEVFYQAPLYPYFLGAVYTVLGDGPWAIRAVQCVLGATGCVLLAVAGHRLASQPVGLTAGAMLALYPPALFFDGLIQKTVLTSFLLCSLLAVMAGLARRPSSAVRWLLAGATVGLLALVRENALVLAVLAPVWIGVWFHSYGCRRFVWGAAFIGGVAGILAPVALRNYAVGGELHLTTSQFGPNFYIGNRADADGFYSPLTWARGDAIYERDDATALAEEEAGSALSPREVSRFWTRKALSEIAADPLRWARLIVRKLWISWNAVEVIDTEDQYTYAEYSPLLAALGDVWHMGVLAPLALFGATLLGARRSWRRRLAWPALAVIGFTASLLLFFLLGRYRYPLVPPLMLVAAAGTWEAVRLGRRAILRRGDTVMSSPAPLALLPAAAALGVALLAAVLVNLPCHPIDQMKGVTRENLGAQLFAEGYPAEMALEQYELAVKHYSDSTAIRMAYARFLWATGRIAQGLSQMEEAAQRSGDPAVLIEAGLMHRALADYASADDRLRRAVTAAPDRAEPLFHLAATRLQWAAAIAAEETEEAAEIRELAATDLRRAKAIEPGAPEIRSLLARALEELGQSGEAEAERAAAIELTPSGEKAEARRRQFERQLGGIQRYGNADTTGP